MSITPYIDLHTHTLGSDGDFSAFEVVEKARSAGIRILSITDHNYTEDLAPLRRAFLDMTLIQGVEINALHQDGDQEFNIHIVGLGIDPENAQLKNLLARNNPDRRPYVEAILKRLREENGIDLGTYDELKARYPEKRYLGRSILASRLTELGYTASVDEGFRVYLGAKGERRAYVRNPIRYGSLEETIRTIAASGGIPVLAHLMTYGMELAQQLRLVRRFSALVHEICCPAGMEVYYGKYRTAPEREYLLALSREYDLMPSAGSDYHRSTEDAALAHAASWIACRELLKSLGVPLPYPEPNAAEMEAERKRLFFL